MYRIPNEPYLDAVPCDSRHMPECVRCGAFTDNPAEEDYHYCDECLDRFAEIERSGVIVEQNEPGGDYHVIVTDQNASLDGGTELSQTDALARGKYICDECGLDGLFKYKRTGSRWVLEEYLRAHPSLRQEVHERLRRVPEQTEDGFLDRVRKLF